MFAAIKAPGKQKDGRQTTLFGLPPGPGPEKKSRGKPTTVVKGSTQQRSQTGHQTETLSAETTVDLSSVTGGSNVQESPEQQDAEDVTIYLLFIYYLSDTHNYCFQRLRTVPPK